MAAAEENGKVILLNKNQHWPFVRDRVTGARATCRKIFLEAVVRVLPLRQTSWTILQSKSPARTSSELAELSVSSFPTSNAVEIAMGTTAGCLVQLQVQGKQRCRSCIHQEPHKRRDQRSPDPQVSKLSCSSFQPSKYLHIAVSTNWVPQFGVSLDWGPCYLASILGPLIIENSKRETRWRETHTALKHTCFLLRGQGHQDEVHDVSRLEFVVIRLLTET